MVIKDLRYLKHFCSLLEDGELKFGTETPAKFKEKIVQLIKDQDMEIIYSVPLSASIDRDVFIVDGFLPVVFANGDEEPFYLKTTLKHELLKNEQYDIGYIFINRSGQKIFRVQVAHRTNS